jgi:hypothetical protein
MVKLKNTKNIRIAYGGGKLAYSDGTDCVKLKLGYQVNSLTDKYIF